MIQELMRAVSRDADRVVPIDKDLIDRLSPLGRALERYFRFKATGLERIPPGPALLVGNHNAGITFMEPVLFGLEWHWRTRGQDPMYWLAHDAMVALPGLGRLLVRLGAIRADHQVARQAFEAGRKVVVFPGGNWEAFRPFSERNKVDFAGRTGFLSLAVRQQVPIVPLASVGGHETFVVLRRGERLAKLLGIKRFLRSDSFPILLAAPWGVAVGPLFHLPLPARLEVEVGEPIPVTAWKPEDADHPERLKPLYDQVVGSIQRMVDRMSAERRARVVG